VSKLGEGTAIVGVGETRLGLFPDRTTVDLQAEAVMAALRDAGLGRADVDGLFNLGPMSQPIPLFGMMLAEYLGIHPTLQTVVDAGGTWSMIHLLVSCVQAVQSGLCSVAVGTFGENAATGRTVAGRGWTTTAGWPEYEVPFGISGAVTPYALLASRHMAEFGTTSDALCEVAMSARRHASLNENAFRRSLFTRDEYFASRFVSTPLRLLDCSTIIDGAGAVVVTSAERARDLPNRPVEVLSYASHLSHRNVGQFTSFDDLKIGDMTATALGRAGLALSDIDVVEVHDAFTFSTLLFVEEIGLCGRGECGAYAAGGGLDIGGPCPVNTHGGLLSQGHVGGMLHVTEAVHQVRGTAGPRQVMGAEVAMVAGGGGMFGGNAALTVGVAR
jgi:acetyl-CoA acetyltransferase